MLSSRLSYLIAFLLSSLHLAEFHFPFITQVVFLKKKNDFELCETAPKESDTGQIVFLFSWRSKLLILYSNLLKCFPWILALYIVWDLKLFLVSDFFLICIFLFYCFRNSFVIELFIAFEWFENVSDVFCISVASSLCSFSKVLGLSWQEIRVLV